jgi:hypothetical protein
MKLTRRDALAAVVASTAGVATIGGLLDVLTDGTAEADDVTDVLSGLTAAAEVVFPSAVEVTDSFLRTYVLGREYDREGFIFEVRDALDALDRHGREQYGSGFAALSQTQRDSLLREIGTDSVTPDPEGTEAERIRHYVVNELLCALYTTPKGGELVGNESPPGYAGGTEVYTEGPDR